MNTLGKLIDRELEKSLPEIVRNYVYSEAGSFLGTPLSVTALNVSKPDLPSTAEHAQLASAYGRYFLKAYGKVIQNRPKGSRF